MSDRFRRGPGSFGPPPGPAAPNSPPDDPNRPPITRGELPHRP
jgi:hypothetical protein